jgi:HNH endonuclease
MTDDLECADCGATLKRVRDGVRGPKRCDDCREAHQRQCDHDRMLRGCEAMKQKRRALRNPNCLGCGQLMVRDDSGPIMDTRKYCGTCITKRKRSQDSRRIGARPLADIMREAAERRAQPITQELLKQLFLYDSNTGVFTRLGTGLPTGKKKRGYILIDVFGRPRPAHQLAWIYCHGEIPTGIEVDHIDRNPSHNKISNLRLSTRSQNQMNTGVSSASALGIKCVFRWRNGYRTKIAINGKQTLIGDYATPLAAWQAYAASARQHFGQFACLQAEDEVRRLSDAEMARRGNRRPFKQRRLRDRCLLAA